VSYPGVYIEEIPSGVRTITGVATSITAFLGRTSRGPVNEPTIVNNFGEFERLFGGLAPEYTVPYAVQDFFGNGGSQAVIVRVYKPFFPDDATRAAALAAALAAAGPGATAQAQTAASAVSTAATTAAGLGGATAASVAAAAAAQVAAAGAPGQAAQLAAQQVATAAQTEAALPVFQQLAIAGNPTAGTIQLSFGGQHTPDLNLTDLTAATAETTVHAALEALGTIGAGNIAGVTRSGTTPNFTFEITFGGTLATPPNPIAVSDSLTGGTESVTISGLLPDAASVAAAASNAVAGAVIAAASAAANAAAGAAAPINRARLTFGNGLVLEAATPGAWGNELQVTVDYDTKPQDDGTPDPTLYNLTITDGGTGKSERIRNVTGTATDARWVSRVLTDESSLVRVVGTPPTSRPATGTIPVDATGQAVDSQSLLGADFIGDANYKTGLYALAKADLFNLLCIPPDTRNGDTPVTVYQKALEYCGGRRAMLLVDSPVAWSANPDTAASAALAGLSALGLNGPAARNAALFFPRLQEFDPMHDGQVDTFVPCGAMAGIFARTDSTRGVWKAPAGLDAAINGIAGLEVALNDGENGQLNPLAINSLRSFPAAGPVIWGSRTLRGADSIGDEYKYVPVRRLALYLEETLYRNTQWVVFEPNDEPLWSQIRLNIGAFMHGLFRQGAFQGKTPKDAYFVKCDAESTTQDDINHGIVNIIVGFAPLKPAEFVIIQIQQMAGQIAT
jgi:phage tail sheath protein FI